MSGSSNPDAPAAAPDNTLTLLVGGKKLTGWQSIRVTRGLEHMPGVFDLSVTEREPNQTLVVIPGDACVVSIDADPILTGWIDRYAGSIAPGEHTITITGRGKCQDLVDCAAVYAGSQIVAGSVLQLASDLAKPYGITVTGEAGPPVPQFNLNLGETPWEIIDRVSRYAALLPYEGTDGNLVLAKLGASKHSSGFAQGENIQTANIAYTMDQRFSEYVSAFMSVDRLAELGTDPSKLPKAFDKGVKRFRRRVIISEQVDNNGVSVAKLRAEWEMARRFGRSQVLIVVCDAWRDSAGALWEPNKLARVDVPALKLEPTDWLISEVTYMRDARAGTTARVVLMPAEAFTPEPIILNPFSADLNRGIQEGNAGAAASASAAPIVRGPTPGAA